MRVVLGHPAGEEEEDLDLRLERDDATVGDLLDALGDGISARGIVIDGRFCHVDLALAEIGMYEGARIEAADGAPGPGHDAADDAALELRVIAGFDAGRRFAPTARRPGGRPRPRLRSGARRRGRLAAPPPDRAQPGRAAGHRHRSGLGQRHLGRGTPDQGADRRSAGDGVRGRRRRLHASPPASRGCRIDPVRQASLAGTIAFNRPPRTHVRRGRRAAQGARRSRARTRGRGSASPRRSAR